MLPCSVDSVGIHVCYRVELTVLGYTCAIVYSQQCCDTPVLACTVNSVGIHVCYRVESTVLGYTCTRMLNQQCGDTLRLSYQTFLSRDGCTWVAQRDVSHARGIVIDQVIAI